MSEQVQTPDQQAGQVQGSTGAAPQGTPTPAPQSAAPVQLPGQPQGSPTPAPVQQASGSPPTSDSQQDTWEARYRGQQRVLQQTVEELRGVQQQAQEATQYAGTLEQQLGETQQAAQTAQQQLTQAQQELAVAQREAGFYSIINAEFPDLAQLAPYIQRAESPDAQRQILTELRQRLGAQVTQQAAQQVAQNYAGATPGTSPVPGGNPLTPTYGEVMDHVLDDNLARDDPDTWAKWWKIYQSHPEMNYESLGLGPFHDPFATHIQAREAMLAGQAGQQQPRARQVDADTGLGDGVWRQS